MLVEASYRTERVDSWSPKVKMWIAVNNSFLFIAVASCGTRYRDVNRGSETQLLVTDDVHSIVQSFNPFNAGTAFIRLTYKDDPRIERNKIFLMNVDP